MHTYNDITQYDGHRCHHEIMHRQQSNSQNIPYLYNLYRELSKIDTIKIAVNLYTLYNLPAHLESLKDEFPNIKTVVLYIETEDDGSMRYDNVAYNCQFDNMFSYDKICSNTDNFHNFIITFNWEDYIPLTVMSITHNLQNKEKLASLYWTGEDIYSSFNFSLEDMTSYHNWYLSFRQYHMVSTTLWDHIILSKLISERDSDD